MIENLNHPVSVPKLSRFWPDAGSIGPEQAQFWHVGLLESGTGKSGDIRYKDYVLLYCYFILCCYPTLCVGNKPNKPKGLRLSTLVRLTDKRLLVIYKCTCILIFRPITKFRVLVLFFVFFVEVNTVLGMLVM